ncbi:MAG: hypothetical protein AB8E82_17230 [Aureispira sp.]
MNFQKTFKFAKTNLLIGVLLSLITIPYSAHAEAFKGGLLSSSAEKALFFIFVLFVIAMLLGGVSLLLGIWEWLQTGKKDKLKRYFPWIFLLLIGTLVITFVVFLLLI